MHYLFAKYAPIHPKLYFDHWAKPVYVLLASPFAQFGFNGIKVFNAIVSLLNIYFTFRIAQKLNLKNDILVAAILIFAPLNYILTFSGLTEPLFALFISLGFFLILQNRLLTAAILLSFLPFVRSEGLIIIGVFGLWFLVKRQWKLLPLLMFGHVFYSLVGFFVYHDFLWVFNKIPYTGFSSIYGSGELFHFFYKLIYVLGVPLYIFMWLGVICLIWGAIKRKISFEFHIIILLGFLAFFVAHSLFWYLGIFNSAGFNRVFLGIMPLMSILALVGFNFITEDIFKIKRIPKMVLQSLLIFYIVVFPFTNNPAAIHWNRELKLHEDQLSAIKVAEFITTNYSPNHRFVFTNPYLSEVLKIDPFDAQKRINLSQKNVEESKAGDIIIWENWAALMESGVTKESLSKNPELINVYDSKVVKGVHEVEFVVFIRK
jgi:hypothetical protein